MAQLALLFLKWVGLLGFGGDLYSDFKSGFSQAGQSSSDDLFSKVAKLLNFVLSFFLHETALMCHMYLKFDCKVTKLEKWSAVDEYHKIRKS